jgi:hypothetical protein
MDNQGPPENDRNRSDDGLSPVEKTTAISTDAEKSATTNDLPRVEKQMTGFERATLQWAKRAVLMAFLAAIFVCAQWWEMHSSSGDTHDLAVAAKAQSDQAKAQTEKMAESLRKTDDLIRATNDLASQAKRQRETMNGQLNVMQTQLDMSERPWVVSEYIASAPFTFTPDGGATFEVIGKVTNIGHSVALRVHDTPLITLQEEEGIKKLRPTDDQKEVCDRIRDMAEKFPNFASGETLFPQGVSYMKYPLTFTKEQVEKSRIGKTDMILGPIIIGCVDYAFSFSPEHHQTGYVYEIVRSNPGNIGSFPIKIGETVPPNQLIMRRSLFGGFYAD